MTLTNARVPLPRSDEEFAGLHTEVAMGHALDAAVLGEELAREFGPGPVHTALRGLLIETWEPEKGRAQERARFDRFGWRDYLA